MRDTLLAWIRALMITGIALAAAGSVIVGCANQRLRKRIQLKRDQRRAEREAAAANIDALAGRQETPSSDEPTSKKLDG